MKALEVPDDCYSAIKLPPEEVPARLKKELAVRLYSKGLLTFGKARQQGSLFRGLGDGCSGRRHGVCSVLEV